MRIVPFKSSLPVSIGVELEFQLVDPFNFDLTSRAKELLRGVGESTYQEKIKPEITQSMIEINSSIHSTPRGLEQEFLVIHDFLLELSRQYGVRISGGGTHPFQQWSLQKIFPTKRYKNLSHVYRYLSKRSTVFGQHIHIGCKNGDDAIYLTHALSRFVPHFIALSASSPFYQGIDTGFHSSRVSVFNAFPLSGVMPFVTTWEEFSAYYLKMRRLRIISSMKDFYWDIRPKPEYGTVEIRVCDSPLTMRRAVIIAAYAQALAAYISQERPWDLKPNVYDVYTTNRFQASRYGFAGKFIDPVTLKSCLIGDDMLGTLQDIQSYAAQLDIEDYLQIVKKNIIHKQDDATIIRNACHRLHSLPEVVREGCQLWADNR